MQIFLLSSFSDDRVDSALCRQYLWLISDCIRMVRGSAFFTQERKFNKYIFNAGASPIAPSPGKIWFAPNFLTTFLVVILQQVYLCGPLPRPFSVWAFLYTYISGLSLALSPRDGALSPRETPRSGIAGWSALSLYILNTTTPTTTSKHLPWTSLSKIHLWFKKSRVIEPWNNLSPGVVDFRSLKRFKYTLKKIYFSPYLKYSYD